MASHIDNLTLQFEGSMPECWVHVVEQDFAEPQETKKPSKRAKAKVFNLDRYQLTSPDAEGEWKRLPLPIIVRGEHKANSICIFRWQLLQNGQPVTVAQVGAHRVHFVIVLEDNSSKAQDRHVFSLLDREIPAASKINFDDMDSVLTLRDGVKNKSKNQQYAFLKWRQLYTSTGPMIELYVQLHKQFDINIAEAEVARMAGFISEGDRISHFAYSRGFAMYTRGFPRRETKVVDNLVKSEKTFRPSSHFNIFDEDGFQTFSSSTESTSSSSFSTMARSDALFSPEASNTHPPTQSASTFPASSFVSSNIDWMSPFSAPNTPLMSQINLPFLAPSVTSSPNPSRVPSHLFHHNFENNSQLSLSSAAFSSGLNYSQPPAIAPSAVFYSNNLDQSNYFINQSEEHIAYIASSSSSSSPSSVAYELQGRSKRKNNHLDDVEAEKKHSVGDENDDVDSSNSESSVAAASVESSSMKEVSNQRVFEKQTDELMDENSNQLQHHEQPKKQLAQQSEQVEKQQPSNDQVSEESSNKSIHQASMDEVVAAEAASDAQVAVAVEANDEVTFDSISSDGIELPGETTESEIESQVDESCPTDDATSTTTTPGATPTDDIPMVTATVPTASPQDIKHLVEKAVKSMRSVFQAKQPIPKDALFDEKIEIMQQTKPHITEMISALKTLWGVTEETHPGDKEVRRVLESVCHE